MGARRPRDAMTSERFNELLAGPLSHPMPILMLNRLAIALFTVVTATGEAGARALEEHCKERQERDDNAV